ncbi:ferric reductase like transmembrane component [Diaporthe helianthi]|uniref:Ferric reductase like transmembrane component n=1 Tax=Diaporthe helianthi TaxID=158607 RepID=A0A2P5I5M0_DIAHE|nr:ferric reductase like transmembrane component [Diaporthe helianthi]
MGWPWKFVSLDQDEIDLRRQTLDRYAGLAQLSAFVPVLLFLGYRLASWAYGAFEAKKGAYNAIPESPLRKVRRQGPLGVWESQCRHLRWWLGDDVVFLGRTWGQRDEWVFGLTWGFWMLVLTVAETGDDYLHLTKRAGAIAMSQLPLQYLLALKSLNPVAYIFNSSHEHVNRYHRVLGRIIYTLLLVHALLYLNFFVASGNLAEKLTTSRAVQTGMLGTLSMTLLNTTTLRLVRTYSYRIFFIVHLVVAMIIPPLIWFHAHHPRVFLVEALVVLLADIITRKFDTITAVAKLEKVPNTDLVKITAPVPKEKIQRFVTHPGSHIYLQIPAEGRPSDSPASAEHMVHGFLYNPFTVADVDAETGDITLVARHLSGPMTTSLNQIASNNSRHDATKIPLSIEGPYGVAGHLKTLAEGEFDRTLLVAGGVGATYTVPLYRALAKDNPDTQVQLIWAVRDVGDASWATSGKAGQGFTEDEGVRVFVTAPEDKSPATQGPGDVDVNVDVELTLLQRSGEVRHQLMRPNLKKIVDEMFQHGQDERVAVFFCGPTAMGRDLRNHVGVWVRKGRVVFWHSESFGW